MNQIGTLTTCDTQIDCYGHAYSDQRSTNQKSILFHPYCVHQIFFFTFNILQTLFRRKNNQIMKHGSIVISSILFANE